MCVPAAFVYVVLMLKYGDPVSPRRNVPISDPSAAPDPVDPAAGPLVKIQALSEWGAPVQVELSQERFRELQLLKEETVFLIPKELKVFQKKAV